MCIRDTPSAGATQLYAQPIIFYPVARLSCRKLSSAEAILSICLRSLKFNPLLHTAGAVFPIMIGYHALWKIAIPPKAENCPCYRKQAEGRSWIRELASQKRWFRRVEVGIKSVTSWRKIWTRRSWWKGYLFHGNLKHCRLGNYYVVDGTDRSNTIRTHRQRCRKW